MSNYGPSGGPYRDQPQDPWHGRPPQDPYEQPADPWGGQEVWTDTTAATSGPPAAPGSPASGQQPGYGSRHGYEQGVTHEQGSGFGHGQGYPQNPAYGQPYQQQEAGYGYGQEPTYQDGRSTAGYEPGGYQPGYAHGAPRPVPPQPAPPPVWSQPVPPPPRRGLSTGLGVLIGVLALVVAGGIGTGIYLLNNDEPGTDGALPGSTPTVSASADAGEPSADPTASGSATDARFATKGQCLVNKGTSKKPAMEIAECDTGTYEVLARFDGTKDYAKKCNKVPSYQYYYFFDSDLDTLDFVLCLKKR